MRKIAVYARHIKDHNIKTVIELLKKLDKLDCKLVLRESLYERMRNHVDFTSTIVTFETHRDIEGCSFLISIGGDGTLLDTIGYIRNSGIPVIGFNIGRMGFLANTTLDDIDVALEKILNNDYSIDKRTLIRAEGVILKPGDINYVLNEVSLSKSDVSSMIKINAYVNDTFVNTYWADGLIISTPTGSTAYSLSCGGPILVPDTNCFIITPIASHNLTVGPVVIADDNKIHLEVDAKGKPYILNLDSRKIKLKAKQKITLSKENFTFNLIKLDEYQFFSTIRNKLLWGIDKRN